MARNWAHDMARKKYIRHPWIEGKELLERLGAANEAEAWCRIWMLRVPYVSTQRFGLLLVRTRQLDHALKREAQGKVPFCCIACCKAFRWCEETPRAMLETLRKRRKEVPPAADGECRRAADDSERNGNR